jgi:hypothetical protein
VIDSLLFAYWTKLVFATVDLDGVCCALPLQSTRPSCQLQLIEARIRFTWLGDVVMKQVRTCCPRGRLYLELRAVAFDLDGPSSLLAESASGGEGILHELEIHDLPVAHLCVDRER